MRRLIAKNIGYPLYDLVTKCNILQTSEFLEKTQWWSKEKLENLQLIKLKKLLKHCYENVPYYHKLFKKINFNLERIKSPKDIKKIPILTKDIVKNQGSHMISQIHINKSLNFSTTGGTTGSPLIVFRDSYSESWLRASFYRFYKWMGLNLGDPRVTIWGQRIIGKNYKIQFLKNVSDWLKNDYRINAFNISTEKSIKHLKKLYKIQPLHIHGYCNAVYNFALIAEKYFKKKLNLKAVSTTCEVLQDFHRKKFKDVFGCETFNQYGCVEINLIAQECNYHQGLHINQESVIFEVMDEKINTNSRSRKVIITDLDNFVMPFIRYQNGDICTLLSNKKCPCGRELPLIKNIEGRIGDIICTPTGVALHPEFFTHLLNESKISFKYNLKKYQVIQESQLELIWNLVLDRKLNNNDKKSLEMYIEKFLPAMDVKINIVDEIPNEKSGKFIYVKSKIRNH